MKNNKKEDTGFKEHELEELTASIEFDQIKKAVKSGNLIPVESPYYDKNGKEIKRFNLIKVFQFKGVNEQGRGRKNYYMYKWIGLEKINGMLWWVGYHLENDSGDFYVLGTPNQKERILTDVEIIQ